MAADVSSLVRLLSRYVRENGGGDVGAAAAAAAAVAAGGGGEGRHRSDLVTRDLLSGCCVVGGAVVPALGAKKELYPNMQVPTPAGERRPETTDLNLPPLWFSGVPPPAWRAGALGMPGPLQQNPAPALDLKQQYQSVCTLEKVRSALERAERESRRKQQHQPDPSSQPPRAPAGSAAAASSSSTTTISSAKRRLGREEEGDGESGSPPAPEPEEMAAAGCPGCLLYVLVSRSSPRCPRCSSAVPLPPPPPSASKKPRIDLNNATSSAPASSPIRTVKFF